MQLAKAIGRFLGLLRAAPHVAAYLVAAVIIGRDRAFVGASERIARIPGHWGVYTRQFFYHIALHHVGRDVYFGYMSVFSKPQASIGDRVYIGRFCSLGWVEIGQEGMLADGVQVLSGGRQHGTTVEGGSLRDNPLAFTQVTIGKGAWLGAGAVVMADVGDHAIVAAGAVVNKPVPAHSRVGGVPAKALKPD